MYRETRGLIPVIDIIKACILRHFPIVESDEEVLNFLGMDKERQGESLRLIFHSSLLEYSRYCPLMLPVKSRGPYVSNFDDFIEEKIGEDELILEPICIPRISNIVGKVTRPFWSYDRDRITSVIYTGMVKGFFDYPVKIFDIFSEKSVIYGLNKGYSKPELFQVFFDYEFISVLNRNSRLFEFESVIPLNFEDFLESLKEAKEKVINDSVNIVTAAGSRVL